MNNATLRVEPTQKFTYQSAFKVQRGVSTETAETPSRSATASYRWTLLPLLYAYGYDTDYMITCFTFKYWI